MVYLIHHWISLVIERKFLLNECERYFYRLIRKILTGNSIF